MAWEAAQAALAMGADPHSRDGPKRRLAPFGPPLLMSNDRSRNTVVRIRPAAPGDAEQLLMLRRALFAETSLLLWESAEFVSTVEQEAQFIERITSRANSLLLVACASGRFVGFLAAIGGERNRVKHSALLALGILREQWSQGIASKMLRRVIAWAPGAGVKRLELTVHTSNDRAVSLYRKFGFEVEGTRRCSLLVDGEFKDEYLMSHIAGI